MPSATTGRSRTSGWPGIHQVSLSSCLRIRGTPAMRSGVLMIELCAESGSGWSCHQESRGDPVIAEDSGDEAVVVLEADLAEAA